MEVVQIALSEILVEESRNHRVDVDAEGIEILAADIRRKGLTNPVTLRKVDGGYRVVAGARRCAACRVLGWNEIPAVVRELSDSGEADVRAAENLLQKALSPVEEAIAIGTWLTEANLSIDQASIMMKRPREWIAGRLEIQHYPDVVQEALHQGVIGLGVARQLVRVKDPDRLVQMLGYIGQTGANVRTVAQWVLDWEEESLRAGYEPGRVTSPDQTFRPVVPMTTCAICEKSIRLSMSSQVCLCGDCVPILQEVGRTVRDGTERSGS